MKIAIVDDIAEELTVGQTVEAKILDIDTERKRISLSIKQALEPEVEEEEELEEAEIPAETLEAPAEEASESEETAEEAPETEE